MKNPTVKVQIFVILLVANAVFGSLPAGRNVNSLLKGIQRLFSPGRSRHRVVDIRTLTSKSQIVSVTAATTVAPSTAAPVAEIPSQNLQDLNSEISSQKLPFNPADLLGQLTISFDKPRMEGSSRTGDLSAQFVGMLPILLGGLRPALDQSKGSDGYDGVMGFVKDAKELLSNREVIRRVNEFLDEIIVGESSQTPPTPSDSSLKDLAAIAQSLESFFNVPLGEVQKEAIQETDSPSSTDSEKR